MFVISAEDLRAWVVKELGVDPPESAVRRAQVQLTVFTRSYFAPPRPTLPVDVLNQETSLKAKALGDLSWKARRLYQNSVRLPEGRFHYGKVFTYDREEAITRIILLWTKDAVELSDAKESKISGPLCSKTVELLDSSVFSDPTEATLLPVSDLRATIARDKKNQKMMWVGFDGKNFYRQKERGGDSKSIPMDGASEIVSFFQADKEIMCSTVGQRLVLVGPQRTAVVE